MRQVLKYFVLGFLVGCSKSPDAASTSKSVSTLPEGWRVYEDDMFKTVYPPDSILEGAKGGIQNPKNIYLSIIPPNDNRGGLGALFVAQDDVTKNMLLRDAIESDIPRYKGPSGVVVATPKEVPVGNGRCLTALVITPSDACAQKTGPCYSPLILTQCDAPGGVRYNVHTGLAEGPSKTALSEKAQQQAAVYERMLRALEFKKT